MSKLTSKEVTKLLSDLSKIEDKTSAPAVAIQKQLDDNDKVIEDENIASAILKEYDSKTSHDCEILSFDIPFSPIAPTDEHGNIRKNAEGVEDQRLFYAILTLRNPAKGTSNVAYYMRESEMYGLAKSIGFIDPVHMEEVLKVNPTGNMVRVNVLERTVGTTYVSINGKRQTMFTLEPNDNRTIGDKVVRGEIDWYDKETVILCKSASAELADDLRRKRDLRLAEVAKSESDRFQARIDAQYQARLDARKRNLATA